MNCRPATRSRQEREKILMRVYLLVAQEDGPASLKHPSLLLLSMPFCRAEKMLAFYVPVSRAPVPDIIFALASPVQPLFSLPSLVFA